VYTDAQARIVGAAVELFAEHGVGGTSLQMIADEIGVTKAAIYHQFPTKDEIVVAVAQGELARVEAVVDAAEAEPSRAAAREVAVAGIVDLAVERRRMESTLLGDPVIIRYFAHHKPFHRVMARLYALLDDEASGVSAVMLTAAIGGAVMHPLVADFDDDTLRAELLRLARRFLAPPS
jgi:AcrR family transcriptional regulator